MQHRTSSALEVKGHDELAARVAKTCANLAIDAFMPREMLEFGENRGTLLQVDAVAVIVAAPRGP
jgi:hypothetical protein